MHRPRIERLHHVTIEVPSLERALDLWRDALGVSPDIRELPDRQMREAAFPVGDLEVRLWQSTAGGTIHGAVLRQVGLEVASIEAALDACRAAGLQPAEPGPAWRPEGRRRTLVDLTGHAPAIELVEAPPSVMSPTPVGFARTRVVTRTGKRPGAAARPRGAKPLQPPGASKAVPTAKAPRPSVRPRGKVRRGAKKR